MMLQRFSAKKDQILKELSRPDEQYVDASPKGSVDVGIRSLVNEINNSPDYVTTSSCAGRISVYLDGISKPSGVAAVASASGGKGGGKWFFTSHSPIPLESEVEPGTIFSRLGLAGASGISFPPSGATSVQFIHFKFEPMILHILCSNDRFAQTVLTAATGSGFRESGISTLYDSKQRPTPPMVAVRSSGLGFDSIIAFQDSDGNIHRMVEETYLTTLLAIANDRFEKNELRKARFRVALEARLSGKTEDVTDAERPSSKNVTPKDGRIKNTEPPT